METSSARSRSHAWSGIQPGSRVGAGRSRTRSALTTVGARANDSNIQGFATRGWGDLTPHLEVSACRGVGTRPVAGVGERTLQKLSRRRPIDARAIHLPKLEGSGATRGGPA